MKFVYIYPVVPTKRFVDGMALKGATLFRLADYDAMRLGHCLKSKIEYLYLDERVEKADPPSGTDLVIIPVNPPAIGRAFEISSHLLKQGLKVLFFGSYPTLRPKLCARYASAIVRGDVTSVIREVIEDMSRNRLKKWYYANRNLSFDVDRVWEDKPGMFPYLSQLRTSFGCSCESGYADFCNEKVLYPEIVSLHEDLIVKSIAGIKKKIIWLQDDDIFYDLNRARYFFKKIWQFKKEWIVQASSRIFLNRDLLLTLSDAGVRIIILKEDWLPCRLFLDSDRMVEVIKLKRRQIDEIHHHRILAGAKIRFDTDLGKSFNFQ
ncbi:MAG: hypothetical protein ABIL05_03875, partial [candidate division WOR-3 bacterium]